jgi:hypothetical protein
VIRWEKQVSIDKRLKMKMEMEDWKEAGDKRVRSRVRIMGVMGQGGSVMV